jgi:hypothetical protein
MKSIAMLLAIGVCGCAHSPQPDALALQAKCVEAGGEWTPPQVMYPDLKITKYTAAWFVCRLRTTDAGLACTGSGKECQGECVAPPGAKLGQPIASGICSVHNREPNGTLVVWGGRVHDGYPILY